MFTAMISDRIFRVEFGEFVAQPADASG